MVGFLNNWYRKNSYEILLLFHPATWLYLYYFWSYSKIKLGTFKWITRYMLSHISQNFEIHNVISWHTVQSKQSVYTQCFIVIISTMVSYSLLHPLPIFVAYGLLSKKWLQHTLHVVFWQYILIAHNKTRYVLKELSIPRSMRD